MWVSMLKMFVFNFNFFFDKLPLNVFGGVLACKLKPFSMSLQVSEALLGWQLIRSKAFAKFACRRKQHTFVIFLLEYVVPIILQPVRINKPGAPLLGLAKSIY